VTYRLALIVLSALSIAACGGKKPGTYETLATDTAKAAPADAEMDAALALWAERGDVEKLKAAIAAFERLEAARPGDRKVGEMVTRGWYFLADAWTDDPTEQIGRYQKAIEAGKRCIAINTAFAEKVNAGEKEKDIANLLTVEDVPCTYWTASALGKWAKANGIAKSIKYLPTVKAYISRVEELDKTFFYHGPERYWGAYYSVIPSFAGRDTVLSGQYFEKTMAAAPNYLGSYVLRAENLAVANQDVAMFDADLKKVLEFNLDQQPDLKPENSREQLKAKKLMELRSELFDKAALEAAGK
jgi:tetratricopeptide (TPR) repeat protein